MDTLYALWRALRFATFEIPFLFIATAVVLSFARSIDTESALDAVTTGGVGLGTLVCLWAIWRMLRRPRNAFGSAAFATTADVRRAGLRGRGVILGRKGGRFVRFAKPGHLLTFAPTRSGKGVGAVIPNLLDHPGSVVVTDIKGENYRITHGYRETLGRVIAFAPFHDDIESAGYNPIDFIRVGTANDVDDARLIAEMIVAPEGQEPNHWEREARALMTGMLLFIAGELPPHRRNPRELRALLMRDRSGFEAVIESMRESTHPSARRIAEGFSQKEDRERSAVISTAQSRTEVFESPRLAAITSKSTFRLEDLKNGVMSLYLIIPPEYVTVYQPFLRLMVGLSTAAMTRNQRQPRHPVLFLLDELPALGHMRPIEDGIGYLAGYGASLWLFVQDLDQLTQTYRKWRSMIANCAVRQAFNVQDPDTARLLSSMLGQRTVQVSNRSKAGKAFRFGLPSSFSETRSTMGRPLLSPDEVMLLPDNRELLFVNGCKPILAEKVRYFTERRFRGRWDTMPVAHEWADTIVPLHETTNGRLDEFVTEREDEYSENILPPAKVS